MYCNNRELDFQFFAICAFPCACSATVAHSPGVVHCHVAFAHTHVTIAQRYLAESKIRVAQSSELLLWFLYSAWLD